MAKRHLSLVLLVLSGTAVALTGTVFALRGYERREKARPSLPPRAFSFKEHEDFGPLPDHFGPAPSLADFAPIFGSSANDVVWNAPHWALPREPKPLRLDNFGPTPTLQDLPPNILHAPEPAQQHEEFLSTHPLAQKFPQACAFLAQLGLLAQVTDAEIDGVFDALGPSRLRSARA